MLGVIQRSLKIHNEKMYDFDMRLIGERLYHCRMLRGLSQNELAEKTGLKPAYINALEKGERNPSVVNFAKIVNVLNVTWEDILSGIIKCSEKTNETDS